MFSFRVLYFFLYVLFFVVIVAVADHDLLQALFCETVPLISQDVLVRAEGSLYIHTGSWTVLEHGHICKAHAFWEGGRSPREHF